ncbi:MAG TPA: 50S ribosomal protein L29 [Acidimicrobiales bacterium]|nr:50S ribosomal protein L29 [Acidimicrobiales bacterium]
MTKASELMELNDDELAHHLAETREEVFHLRFQLAMGKQDNSARLGVVRREVARVLTLQRQREQGQGRQQGQGPRPAAAAARTKGAR